MVALAIAGEPRFAVERLELERAGPSYTVDTLRALHQATPGSEFALLVGADAARDLPAWHEADALPGLASIVVFARPGATVPALPWPCRVVSVPGLEISATDIRARVAAGRSIRYWVPDPVAEYITTSGLYSSDA
jgi:nicotinate-nucleotide adenylyltransferase